MRDYLILYAVIGVWELYQVYAVKHVTIMEIIVPYSCKLQFFRILRSTITIFVVFFLYALPQNLFFKIIECVLSCLVAMGYWFEEYKLQELFSECVDLDTKKNALIVLDRRWISTYFICVMILLFALFVIFV